MNAPKKAPAARQRHTRSINDDSTAWRRYEAKKAELIAKALPAAEFAQACRRIAAQLGL